MVSDARLTRGVERFNAGEFFTAHEIWEAMWLDTVGAEKLLLQGLVQIAAGYAKVETGARGGAIKLLTRGLERVRQFGPVALGLAIGPFVEGVSADLQRLRDAPTDTTSLDQMRIPDLQLAFA
jgi:predicted metal-dependent hydrolase